MSDVVVILEKLKEEGFSLWLDGEKLRYKAPKESITVNVKPYACE